MTTREEEMKNLKTRYSRVAKNLPPVASGECVKQSDIASRENIEKRESTFKGHLSPYISLLKSDINWIVSKTFGYNIKEKKKEIDPTTVEIACRGLIEKK